MFYGIDGFFLIFHKIFEIRIEKKEKLTKNMYATR